MKFAYPEFLYFLAAIAIPIIIHLFNFRKFKRVYFTNVRFLQEVKRQTQSRSQLRHLLVLAARILAIAALVFAFAQPYIPAEKTSVDVGRKAISVYIDNSFSMDAIGKGGSLLEAAKRQAREIASTYGATDDFQLLTNDFEGKHQRLVKKEEFLDMLEEVEKSPVSRKLSEIIPRQEDILNASGLQGRRAFVLSDFQESMADLSEVRSDSSIATHFLSLKANKQSNVFIDSVWFKTPVRQINQQEELSIRIVNASDEHLKNIPIKLFINGQQKALGSISIEPNSKVDTALFFTNAAFGIQNGRVSIQDYPITYDDDFYFSFNITERQQVLAIHPGSSGDTLNSAFRCIRSTFARDEFFSLNTVGVRNIDYANLAQNSLIILNGLNEVTSGMAQELTKFTNNGGSLLIFPGVEIKNSSYNELLLSLGTDTYQGVDTNKSKVGKLNLRHDIYKGIFERVPTNVDLPTAKKHYKLSSKTRSNRDNLLTLQNGDLFLGQYAKGKGKVYLSAVPLDESYSNVRKHAVFITTLLRIAEFAQPQEKPYYSIGRDEVVELSNITTQGDAVFQLKSAATDFEVIPEHQNMEGKTRIFVHGQVSEAGNYFLNFNKEAVAGLGFNYDRSESRTNPLSKEELAQLLADHGLQNIAVLADSMQNLKASLVELSEGKKLWKICLILALSFLAVEVLLLKFWR